MVRGRVKVAVLRDGDLRARRSRERGPAGVSELVGLLFLRAAPAHWAPRQLLPFAVASR